MEGKKQQQRSNVSSTFKTGAIALAFLAIGYQAALFVHQAASEKIATDRDRPDTVFVTSPELIGEFLSSAPGPPQGLPHVRQSSSGPASRPAAPGGAASEPAVVILGRRDSEHAPAAQRIRESSRRVESFRFNPNTVSVEQLRALGFSEKQAAAIDNYRLKGGRFRRKSDFAKSFVVADSVYERLEPYIDIPLVDINAADSAAFDALPGVGGWTAAKMVSYREELGGYSFKEQLMDIYHFDRQRFDALADLICVGPVADSFALWTLPVEELRRHPYVRTFQTARSIVFYREHNPASAWTIEGLSEAGILSPEIASKLSRCAIAGHRE